MGSVRRIEGRGFVKKKTSKEKKEKENQKRLEAFRIRDEKIRHKNKLNRTRQHHRREAQRISVMNYLDRLEDSGPLNIDRVKFLTECVSLGGKKQS